MVGILPGKCSILSGRYRYNRAGPVLPRGDLHEMSSEVFGQDAFPWCGDGALPRSETVIGLLSRLIGKLTGEARPAVLGTVLGAVVFSGCGNSDTARVAGGGQVSLGGEKVRAASISFQPKSGPGVSALAEVKDGVYAFTRETGPAPGPQRVIIEILRRDKLESMQGKTRQRRGSLDAGLRRPDGGVVRQGLRFGPQRAG